MFKKITKREKILNAALEKMAAEIVALKRRVAELEKQIPKA